MFFASSRKFLQRQVFQVKLRAYQVSVDGPSTFFCVSKLLTRTKIWLYSHKTTKIYKQKVQVNIINANLNK